MRSAESPVWSVNPPCYNGFLRDSFSFSFNRPCCNGFLRDSFSFSVNRQHFILLLDPTFYWDCNILILSLMEISMNMTFSIFEPFPNKIKGIYENDFRNMIQIGRKIYMSAFLRKYRIQYYSFKVNYRFKESRILMQCIYACYVLFSLYLITWK